jgi:hypothetical protein
MRLKNLENYKVSGSASNMKLEIPLPKTPDGRVYRYSPNQDAHPRHFLLGERIEFFVIPTALTSRITHLPGTPGTICPYSGILDEDNAFAHPDDIAAAKEVVAHAFETDVANAFHGLFTDLARNTSGNKSFKVKAGRKPQPKPKPRFARRDLLRELVCDECGRDYGVYAISLFCPDCGAPNIHLHFAREAALVREQVELAEKLGAEHGELAYRLLGNAHEDVLTAFEATLKAVYYYQLTKRPLSAPEVKPVLNSFQNIIRGQRRFAEFDFDPYGSLGEDALAELTLNIQKRHVIGHNLGVADAAFAEHALEARLGETVPLVGEEILRFAEICKQTVDYIDAWLAGGAPFPNGEVLASKRIGTLKKMEPAGLMIGELGKLAVLIGLWISKQSKSGFDDLISEDDLAKAFPDSANDELASAVAELKIDGYLQTSDSMGSRIPRILVGVELFITFDPHTMQTNPASDALTICDMCLAKDESVGVENLHEATGWPLRRFNPAFSYLIAQIDEEHVFEGGTDQFPARGFYLTDEDRVLLKRFSKRIRP